MEKTLTRAEIEARLKAKDEAIARRLDALKGEVAGTGASVREKLRDPVVAVGATLVGGLLVGWMLGGLGRRRRKRRQQAGGMVYEALVDAVAREAARLVRKGYDPEEALREALARRLPGAVPVAAAPPPEAEEGLVRTTVKMAGHMLTTLLLRHLIESAMVRLAPHLMGADEAPRVPGMGEAEPAGEAAKAL